MLARMKVRLLSRGGQDETLAMEGMKRSGEISLQERMQGHLGCKIAD